MSSPPFPYKLAIPILHITCLVIPFTSQFSAVLPTRHTHLCLPHILHFPLHPHFMETHHLHLPPTLPRICPLQRKHLQHPHLLHPPLPRHHCLAPIRRRPLHNPLHCCRLPMAYPHQTSPPLLGPRNHQSSISIPLFPSHHKICVGLHRCVVLGYDVPITSLPHQCHRRCMPCHHLVLLIPSR